MSISKQRQSKKLLYQKRDKALPTYSGKQIVSFDFPIFSSKRSFLFRKRIIDVWTNHLLLQIESNNFILSIILFISSSSAKTKS